MTKLKNFICDKTQKLKFGQNSKTQIWTKLKKSNCEGKNKLIVTKLRSSKCD